MLLALPGTEKATGKKIAIKKIKVQRHRDGLDESASREIIALQELRHPNIVSVFTFSIY